MRPLSLRNRMLRGGSPITVKSVQHDVGMSVSPEFSRNSAAPLATLQKISIQNDDVRRGMAAATQQCSWRCSHPWQRPTRYTIARHRVFSAEPMAAAILNHPAFLSPVAIPASSPHQSTSWRAACQLRNLLLQAPHAHATTQLPRSPLTRISKRAGQPGGREASPMNVSFGAS